MKPNLKGKSLILFLIALFLFSVFQGKDDLSGLDFLSELLAPTPTIIPTVTSIPSILPQESEMITVVRIIDGDTIELEDGRKLRYIGIDTPETVDPRRGVQCFGKEASAGNSELVLNKKVRLEKDVSHTDSFGRLLRYVYLDEMFVNEKLVREGFARAASYPPDVKYQDTLREAERLAREEKKGLWSSCL